MPLKRVWHQLVGQMAHFSFPRGASSPTPLVPHYPRASTPWAQDLPSDWLGRGNCQFKSASAKKIFFNWNQSKCVHKHTHVPNFCQPSNHRGWRFVVCTDITKDTGICKRWSNYTLDCECMAGVVQTAGRNNTESFPCIGISNGSWHTGEYMNDHDKQLGRVMAPTRRWLRWQHIPGIRSYVR